MQINKIGLFLISIFTLFGCSQDSKKNIEKSLVESNSSERDTVEKIPSYDKYREGLENLQMN